MSRLPALLAGATLAYAVYLFSTYFALVFQGPLLALLLLGFVLLLATGAGRVLLRWLGIADVSESQKTVIGATLGLGLLSQLFLLLCAVHALYVPAMMTALAALWVIGATEIRAVILSLGANRNLLRERPLSTAALAGLFGLTLWLTWVPPHQYDSLVYHLPLPAAYIAAHGFVRLPGLVYTHFPQNGEMLFGVALLLGSDLLAQMFMWLAGVLSAWWVFELGKREAPLSAVMLACLMLASHTAFMLLCGITYVEPLVMLWTTACLLCFARWRQLDAAEPGNRGWLLLAGIFLGLALGTKYYAGIAALLLGLWLLAHRRFGDFAFFAGATTLLFSPWLAKNAVMAGNPVFPFFNHLLSPAGAFEYNEQVANGYFKALTEYRGLGGFEGLLRLPKLLLTNDPRFGGGMDVLGTLGWDLTFWTLPLAVWASWRHRFLRFLALFCLAYIACWLATGVVLRFLLVLAPVLSLLCANGLYALRQRLDEAGRAILYAGVGLLMACHVLLFLYVQLGVYGAGGPIVGAQTREQFLSKLDYYPCARWLSDRSDKSDRILIVGEQRSYYLDRAHDATSTHAPNPWVIWANAAENPASFAKTVSGNGYAKILYVPRELRRLGESIGLLSERGAANLQGLAPEFAGPACAVIPTAGR